MSQKNEAKRNKFLLFKRIIVFIVIAALEFGSFPADAFARAARPAADVKKEHFTTLITEAKASDNDTITFTGQGHGVNEIVPALADQQASNLSAGFEETAKVHKLAKQDFRPNEEIDVVIENGAHKEYKTELIDAIGNKVALDTEEVETGAAKVITIEQPSSFRPGKYTLRITDNKGGVSEQDFSWGVLAINPDKSIYAPNETANLAIGVLDEGGDMVCDAQVELQITPPGGTMTSLSTDNGKIKVNEECKSHEFTLKPDYEATYQTGGVGVYKMLLKSQTRNGSFSINDSFEVKDAVAFDVKRISATRIYPPNTYPVTLEITANQDFEGSVSETVPGSFKIARPGENVKTDTQIVDAMVASESADIIAPDTLPKYNAPVFDTDAVIAYNTINTVGDFDGGKAVLGASVPGLGMPFSGMYRVTQEFGQSLVYDEYGHGIYDTFGMNGHDGLDFAMPEGTPLLAVDNGKVLLAGAGDYGTTIVIQHAWGRSYYGHLSAVDVKEGDDVQRGATIARSGNTGLSTGPHLHFGIKPDTNDSNNGYYGKVDPAYYLGMKQTAATVLGAATKFDESINAAPSTDVQILTWKISVKKGDKIKIGYNYLAPRISPQFYTLGPATFTDTTGKEIFHEIRKWQIASDAMDYKFKRGTFTKSSCTAPCTQSVAGVGFKPKAIIFEWTRNTAEGFADHTNMGMGFVTASGSAGLMSERSVSFCSEDNLTGAATMDTSSRHSDTKAIMFQSTDCATATPISAEADLVSFDPDGFTLSWTTNVSNGFIIHYTALGGSDLSNAMASTFTLTTAAGSETVAEPGFQPDFVMFLSTDTTAFNANSSSGTGGRMNVGFASSPSKQGSTTMWSDDNVATSDSRRQQRTDASIALLTTAGAQDALASLSSFEPNGFVLNKSDTPGANTAIFYLALKGGQYDVGAFAAPTDNMPQSIYTGFRPSGIMTLAASSSATTSIHTTGASLSVGGASRDSGTPWCNDTTGTTCTAPGVQLNAASDWCNDTTGVTCTNSWSTRRKITFNNASSSADLTNFPVLVKLDSTRIDYSKTQNSGQDLRFVDPTNPNLVLSHEIESWNESGSSYVWVKVPQLDASSSADFVWMYYGNTNAPDGQDTTNVWDSNYAAVYHMKENPSITNCATNKEVCDSTSNANNADNTALVSGSQVSGKVNGSIDFNGTTQDLLAPDSNSLDITPNISISAWIKADDVSTWHEIVTKHVDFDMDANFGYQIEDTSKQEFYFKIGATYYTHMSNTALSTGQWYHVSVSYDQSNVRFYLNGVADGTTARTVALPTSAEALYIGNNAATERFDGTLDEIRISNSIRSADWIEAEYLTSNDQMNTYGTEQSYSESQSTSGWTARKKITFDNLTSTQDLENFPVLVALSPGKIDYAKTQNAGQDIRFVDPSDPNTVLPHEIESWNESGTSYVWVKVPKIDKLSNTDYIWMYYGNPNASDGQDSLNVWDESYSLVHHLRESASPYQDATMNNKDGSESTNPPTAISTGKIDGAQDFDGGNDKYTSSIPSTLNDFTFSTWVNTDVLVLDYILDVANGSAINEFSLVIDDAIDIWTNGTYRTSTALISTGTWYYVTAKRSGSTLQLYLNGAASGSSATDGTQLNFSTCNLIVGAESSSSCSSPTFSNFLNGRVDEVRVSNIARSDDWIEAEYRTTNNEMNTFGAEEIFSSTTTTYSQGTIWGDDIDNITDSNNSTSSLTNNVIQFPTTPATGAPRMLAKANIQSFDPTGFTVNWTETDNLSRIVLYWAVGSVTASQEDYRWYKNANADTPTTALEDENSPTILAKNKPYARLRTNISSGGNGLNASTQGFKLQYAANQAEAAIGGTTDWCNDTTGITCTAPLQSGDEVPASTTTDWCNDTTGVTCTSDWSARRKITFNNASASASLTDFPVLVKLDSTRIDYSKTQNSGQDLRFVDPSDPNTALNHEIESWNESGTSYVWVKVPTIDGRSNTDYIWMYYGNSTVGSPATQLGNSTHETGVWNSNYAAVYHMKEDPSSTNCPTNKEVCDSTSNTNNADNNNMVSGNQTTGKVNGSLTFNGTTQYLQAPANASLRMTNSITISAWIKPSSVSNFYEIVAQDTPGAADTNYGFQLDGTNAPAGTSYLNFYFENSTVWYQHNNNTPLSANTWHYATVTYDTNNVRMYVNGVADGTKGRSALSMETNVNDVLYIGQNPNNEPFDGTIDEIRVSNNVRTADWIYADYLSQTDTYNTYGTEITLAETKLSNTGWQYRKKIQFNNASASAALTDFPVMVKLDASNIDYNKTQDDGGDIRFVDPADNTTVLAHEIETWNENGTSVVWVKVPSLAAGTDDYVWMYYGNPSASDGQSASSVWDSNFNIVYHMEESSGNITDSAGTAQDATRQGSTVSQGPGQLGYAQKFNSTGYLETASPAAPTGDFTYSLWVTQDNSDNTILLLPNDNAGATTNLVRIYVSSTGIELSINNTFDTTTPPVPPTSTWMHMALTRSGSTTTYYANGRPYTSTITNSTALDTVDNCQLLLGADADTLCAGSIANYLSGAIDEFRVSNTARSTDWIEAEYYNGLGHMSSVLDEQAYTISGTNVVGWRDVADAWCNDTSGITCNTSWAYRKRITFNNQSATATTPFSDGFESGGLTNWTGTEGNITASTENPFSGNYSTKISPAAPTDGAAYKVFTSDQSSAYGHAYVYVKSTPTPTQFDILHLSNTSDSGFIINRDASGYMCIWNSITSVNNCSSSQQIPLDSWHKVEVYVSISPTQGQIKGYFDGVLVSDLNLSGQNTGSELLHSIHIGDWSVDRTATFYVDDVGVDMNANELINFPVLVKLDASRIDYGKTQNDGDDIRFVDPSDPTTVLPFEIESWNESGTSSVWVKVPQIDAKSTSDSIWMYYGNELATSGQDRTNVWDSNFVSVHHLNETVTDEASTGTHNDATTPAENGTQSGNDDQPGRVAKGQDLDGNDQISLGDDADFDFGANQDFTATIWVNTSMGQTAGVWPALFSKENGTTGYAIVVQDEDADPRWYAEVLVSSTYYQVSGFDITDGNWHKLTMQRSGSSLIVYQDGAYIGTSTVPTNSLATAVPFMIGSFDSSDFVDGTVDELKVSNTARSADWIKAEYLTESDQMNTFGNEETQTSSVWRYKDNSNVTNGSTIATRVLGTSTTGSQLTFQESNITSLNPTAIAAGEKREFDFSLDGTNASNRRTYYFRVVNADGTPLTNYTRYPTITVGVPNKKVMRGGKFFNYKTSQPFTF